VLIHSIEDPTLIRRVAMAPSLRGQGFAFAHCLLAEEGFVVVGMALPGRGGDDENENDGKEEEEEEAIVSRLQVRPLRTHTHTHTQTHTDTHTHQQTIK